MPDIEIERAFAAGGTAGKPGRIAKPLEDERAFRRQGADRCVRVQPGAKWKSNSGGQKKAANSEWKSVGGAAAVRRNCRQKWINTRSGYKKSKQSSAPALSLALLLTIIFMTACQQPLESGGHPNNDLSWKPEDNQQRPVSATRHNRPKIEVTPGKPNEGGYFIVTSGQSKVSVLAPGAQSADSDGRPRANSFAGQQAADDNESARSDRKTGGRVERANLQPGAGNLRITLNVPAFLLTLWQDGKEIKTFYVGVGRKNYPIPIGMRATDEIILNPDWIPPDSEWVRAAGLQPYKRIPASSPGNPLGKIKIPLGDAYLLHEAQGTSDIGNLVSHGCIRVLRNDIFQLTQLIVAAHGKASISNKAIVAARKDSKRRVITLGEEIPVDINYDTMVVEGGILHIYPDVYEQKINTVEELRTELEGYEIDVSKLDEAVLKKMLDSVNSDRKFVVHLADVQANQALEKGKTEPLTPYQTRKKSAG